MNTTLKTRLSYATMVLLVVSVTGDVSAYFSGSAFFRAVGLGAILGCVLSCGLNGLGSSYRLRQERHIDATQRQVLRSALVSFTLIVAVIALAIWRWTAGPVVVSSFDGGYPVLVAFSFLLAGYQGWQGKGR